MKTSCMTNVLKKKLAFPVAALCCLLAGTAALAQTSGDIFRIYSPTPNTTYRAGDVVELRIGLVSTNGIFVMEYTGQGSALVEGLINPIKIRVEIGKTLAYATLDTLNTSQSPMLPFFDELIFKYTVQSGDLALPMRLHGFAGGTGLGQELDFLWGQWRLYNTVTGAPVEWRFNLAYAYMGGFSPDPDFEKQNVRIQTLDFVEPSYTVEQTKTILATISTGGLPVENPVPVYVWSDNTNYVRLADQVPGQPSYPLTLLPGQTSVTVRVTGYQQGFANICLSPTATASTTMTNYVSRLVTVLEPPDPTISVTATGVDPDTNTLLCDESDSNDIALKVVLSETYGNDVIVRLDMNPSGQSNVVFQSSPVMVTIEKGRIDSDPILWKAKDGTLDSLNTGIVVSPVIQNTTISNHFKRINSMTVKVNNQIPTIIQPAANYIQPVERHTDASFTWLIDDVAADLATNMVITWKWGHFSGGTEVTTVVTGMTGTVTHKYTSAGDFIVTVEARDKDGGLNQVQFTARVTDGTPPPDIQAVPTVSMYSETNSTGGGSIVFRMSDTYSAPVQVMLDVTYPDPAVTNMIFNLPGPYTIPQGQQSFGPVGFQIVDGTELSRVMGVKLTPVVTNSPDAAAYFKPIPTYLNIENHPPRITRIMDKDVTSGVPLAEESVPAEIFMPFTVQLRDIAADLDSGVWVFFDFGGGLDIVSNRVTRSGVGDYGTVTVSNKFPNAGVAGTTYNAQVWAVDKDGGESVRYSLPIKVGSPPRVSISSPPAPISEKADPYALPDAITVKLSAPFPSRPVTVELVVTPPSSIYTGQLTLASSTIIFPAGETERIVNINTTRDGTAFSAMEGFTITPTVTGPPEAVAFYREDMKQPGNVRVLNVPPIIVSPLGTAVDTTTPSYTVPQGVPYQFSWNIDDVPADLAYGLVVEWEWGDGTRDTVTQKSGTIPHTFSTIGLIPVTVTARDKDGGGEHRIVFKVEVAPSKQIQVTPNGPLETGPYGSAKGLGNGLIFSESSRSQVIQSDVYTFAYDPGTMSAQILAVPYKTGPGDDGYYRLTNYINKVTGLPGTTALGTPGATNVFDSFFYAWVGGQESGLPEVALTPIADPMVVVSLPQASGTGGDAVISQVRAIFSREYRRLDNRGDINLDGIPDIVAGRYNLPELLGSDLTPANGYNKDADDAGGDGAGDFLPGVASMGNALITGMTNSYATVGDPFTAYLEIRGFHPGLNDFKVGRTPDGDATDGPLDEPGATLTREGGTDPTRIDTDSDGFPDGWEYYFWYNATILKQEGVEYNPYDVAQGIPIPSKTITQAFDPLTPTIDEGYGLGFNRDSDRDGLTDYEELVMGLNPVHWDTDGDGMCDGWEVLRGLNPNERDGSGNPDGDYMAYAEVDRQFVTVIDGDEVETTYLAKGAAVDETTGTFTLWYRYGNSDAPLAVGRAVPTSEVFANSARVLEVEDVKAILIHNQVYQEFGFDPRVAWSSSLRTIDHPNRFPGWVATVPHTKSFTSLDEYLLLKYMSELRLNGAPEAMGPGANVNTKIAAWLAYSTHPKTPDSDVEWSGDNVVRTDRMPDGWELYVSMPPGQIDGNMVISPWNPLDGSEDYNLLDGETLTNMREFHGTDSSSWYTNVTQYAMTEGRSGIVTIQRPASDVGWINKFWPTDPYNPDTDGDGLSDAAESTFIYGDGIDNGTVCTPGGGLNPNAMDTDLDALPDAWEFTFRSTSEPVDILAVTNGMDGTVNDAMLDYDGDGLLNYQEYWVQAVRSLRYDIPLTDKSAEESLSQMAQKGQPMDMTFDPSEFFTEVANGVRTGSEGWDHSRYPWGYPGRILWVMLPVGNSKRYVSTDPRDPDSDGDGMDDFYEMFHGLNPILGDLPLRKGDPIAEAYVKDGAYTIDCGRWLLGNDWGAGLLPMDFVNYPWLAGLDDADPDADGLRNLEEQIQADTAAPFNYNTDPSPLWMTDCYSPDSVTARFYSPLGVGNTMCFWPNGRAPRDYMFSFEMNEGYDTDNDGVSDKDELLLTSTAQSDPQNHDDPMRRQALWFGGINAAAQTRSEIPNSAFSFRSFTVELWICPENLTTNQVLIERVVAYAPSDMSTPDSVVRATFRIGIDSLGCVYGLFQNAGVHDNHTGQSIIRSMPGRLKIGTWTHIILRMDGNSQTLDLWLDGQVETSADTVLIPANGVINMVQDPGQEQYPFENYVSHRAGVIVLGASNIEAAPIPVSWDQYENFFYGYIDEVRIWDGACSNLQLQDNYRKRFTRKELMDNRTAVREAEMAGGLRVADYPMQLPAELLYHYTFDNLFGADRVEMVAKVPRGFNHNDRIINRPAGYVVGWWDALPLKSEVYSDYGYVPWIENGVIHLPLDGYSTVGSNLVYRSVFGVRNSEYWKHYSAGVGTTNLLPSAHNLERFEFPNSNNPYGHWYRVTPNGGGESYSSDILPFGGAFAKQTAVMWDVDAPGSVWADTGDDSDSDGMPDWWEELREINHLDGEGNNGWYGDANGDGTSNGEQYLRDIANGWRAGDTTVPTGLKQTADVDLDGLPDWWENIYNLAVEVGLSSAAATASENGSMGDPDRDGLNNMSEYLISEYYTYFGVRMNPRKFKSTASQAMSDYFMKAGLVYFGEIFTDHDFMEYSWEMNFPPEFVNPFVYDAHLDPDQDGWSNWSESRYGASALRSDPSLVAHLNPDGTTMKDYPVPIIEARFAYNSGMRPFGALIIHAFSNPSMNGNPDAIFTLPSTDGDQSATATTKSLGFWGPKKINGVLSPGSVVPSSIRITFTDQTPNPPTRGTSGGSWPVDLRSVLAVVDVGDSDQMGYRGILQAYHGNTTVNVGTINYLTGEYTLDFAMMDGWFLQSQLYDQYGELLRPAVNTDGSYVTIAYASNQINGWPKTLYLSDADVPKDGQPSLGHVKEGLNYFFAFIDLDGNGLWSAGEPCGVDFGVDIGYDRNEIAFDLTDYMPGYPRMMLTGQRSEDVILGTGGQTGGGQTGGGQTSSGGLVKWVTIRRTSINGGPVGATNVLVKPIESMRASLHEGDVLENGQFALDWGFPDQPAVSVAEMISAAYEMYVGPSTNLNECVLVTTFTNTFDKTSRAKVSSISPINGGYVYSSRPTFKWTMPQGLADNRYQAFGVEIRRDSAGGTLVYASDPIKAPVRDINGVYTWEAPIYANSRLPGGQIFESNRVYAWRVIALNSKFSTRPASDIGWSDWKLFRLDVNQERGTSGGFGAIQTRVKYYGPATNMDQLNNRVKVQAFNTAAFSGAPVAEYTLTGTDPSSLISLSAPVVNGLLSGLPDSSVVGDYYVMAFIDHNDNGKRDIWESWGYVNHYGINDKPYDPRAVGVAYAAPPMIVDIVIEDADTDQDWFPDAWEYQEARRAGYTPMSNFLHRIGPSSGSRPDEEINPDLLTSGRTFMAPLLDMTLVMTDSDGDGLDDRQELLLGSDGLNASTAGDGYSDGDKYALGLNPQDTLALRLTGVDISSGMLPEIDWSITVQKSRYSLSSATPDQTWIGYEVVYAPDLSTPMSQWQVVRRGKVNLDGEQTVTDDKTSTIDPASGFFRVRLVP